MNKLQPSAEQIGDNVDVALAEDVSHGDVTSEVLLPPGLQGRASILVKAEGIIAGVEVAKMVFHRVNLSLQFEVLIEDGTGVKSGDIVATVSGDLASILKGERVALNFLQRLSGIASQTAQYIARSRGLSVSITDTRKTTPGLRLLEKYAVRLGGGKNHRFHLGDGILIKDNHLVALRALGLSLREIITSAKQKAPRGLKVEVEVNTLEEAAEAIEAGADTIMLDNMSPDEMRRVVSLVRGRAKLEASGGVTLDNVRAVAMAGVDIISIGALTHSVKVLDISLELESQSLRLDY